MDCILLQGVAEIDAPPSLLCMPVFIRCLPSEASRDVLCLDAEYAALANLHMIYLMGTAAPVAYEASIDRIVLREQRAAVSEDAAYPSLTRKAPCL